MALQSPDLAELTHHPDVDFSPGIITLQVYVHESPLRLHREKLCFLPMFLSLTPLPLCPASENGRLSFIYSSNLFICFDQERLFYFVPSMCNAQMKAKEKMATIHLQDKGKDAEHTFPEHLSCCCIELFHLILKQPFYLILKGRKAKEVKVTQLIILILQFDLQFL